MGGRSAADMRGRVEVCGHRPAGGGLRQSQMQHEWHLLQALPCRSPRLHRHMRRGLARQHRSKPQGRRPPLRMAIQHQRPSLQFQQRTLRATFLMASRPRK